MYKKKSQDYGSTLALMPLTPACSLFSPSFNFTSEKLWVHWNSKMTMNYF